jgi:hypothetical protein
MSNSSHPFPWLFLRRRRRRRRPPVSTNDDHKLIGDPLLGQVFWFQLGNTPPPTKTKAQRVPVFLLSPI